MLAGRHLALDPKLKDVHLNVYATLACARLASSKERATNARLATSSSASSFQQLEDGDLAVGLQSVGGQRSRPRPWPARF